MERHHQKRENSSRRKSRSRNIKHKINKHSSSSHSESSESSESPKRLSQMKHLKKGLIADNTQYTLNIANNSGEDQNIAVYQTLPSAGAIPVVWFSKQINNGNTFNFSWFINWGLTWGTTEAPLAPGVTFASKGVVQPVSPFPTGVNSIKIGFSGDFYLNPFNDKDIPEGQLSIHTSADFTTDDAKFMQVAVTMNNTAAFIMRGKPKGTYNFITTPKYYVAVKDTKVGNVISGSFISDPAEVVFNMGITEVTGTLDNSLNFTFKNTQKVGKAKRIDNFTNDELTTIKSDLEKVGWNEQSNNFMSITVGTQVLELSLNNDPFVITLRYLWKDICRFYIIQQREINQNELKTLNDAIRNPAYDAIGVLQSLQF